MTSASGTDIWIRELAGRTTYKLTGEGTANGYPSWTPDSRSVTYYSNAGGSAELWTKPADGSEHATLQLSMPRDLAESSWSPDGTWLIFRTSNVPMGVASSSVTGAADILAIRPGTDAGPIRLATTPTAELGPSLSPGGRWLAYSSFDTGKEEVYVVPFPETGSAKWSSSPDGGTEPAWSRAGDELFYRDPRGDVHAVEVRTTPAFSLGRDTTLLDGRNFVLSGLHPMYDVSLDGRRFLMVRTVGEPDPGQLIVVENRFRELGALRGRR